MGLRGIEMGDLALPAERINHAKGSVELKKCRSRVGLSKDEAENVGWNQRLKGLEQQAEEPGLCPAGRGHHYSTLGRGDLVQFAC